MTHHFIGKFRLGQILATPGVLESICEDDRISALTRHHNGDWGEVSENDKAEQ